ncbi:MAG: class I adenylate-forming enzyme family protein [Pseudomonadales bacterium]
MTQLAELKQEYDNAIGELTKEGAMFELGSMQHNGHDYTIYKNAPETMLPHLDSGRAHGDKEFLVYEGERYTYNEVYAAADSLANALAKDFNIGTGDRVAIAMRNYPEWIVGFLGIAYTGATIVPLNSWGQKAELEYGLTDSEAKLVLIDEQRLSYVVDDLPAMGVQAIAVRTNNELLEKPNVSNYSELMGSHLGASVPVPAVSPDDLFLMLYTSGTTGRPKGAMTSHRALSQAMYSFDVNAYACSMCNGEAVGKMLAKGYDQASLLAVPLFHMSGLHAGLLLGLRGGRKLVMMYKWEADKAIRLIEQERLTIFSVAPAMLQEVFNSPVFDETDTTSLFNIGAGGSATPPKVTEMIAEKVDSPYQGCGWGLTETNTSVCSFTGKAMAANPTSSGFVHPIVELQARDDDGNVLPAGQAGVFWAKTIALIDGYWNRPDANAEDFVDGWFCTGDIGYLDELGYVYLSDRAKDMIIRGGENVYPAEIEAAFFHHPAVSEAGVFAVPDDRLGEEVGAAVVLKTGMSASEEELRELVAGLLARYKVPRYIWTRNEPLPRNPSGKILKKQLREEYAPD